MKALVDGQLVAGHDTPGDDADGVFRTLLVCKGLIHEAAAQHAVLEADAQRLGLHVAPLGVWLADSAVALAGVQQAALRWRVERTDSPNDVARPRRRVYATPLPPDRPAHFWTEGIHAEVSAVRLVGPPELAGIKHLDRALYRQAARHWQSGQAEALLCDAAGHLVCGARSNLFWVSGGTLFTPPLDRVGVRGLMHRKIRALAAALKVPLETGRVHPEQLNDAEELFVTNSLIGLWPLRRLGTRRWPAPGPMTRTLREALYHPLADLMWAPSCGG